VTNNVVQQDPGVPRSSQGEMLELGRSMLRFSWAMTVFGAQQAASVIKAAASVQAKSAAAAAFDAVAHTVEGQFRGVFRGAHDTPRDWFPGFGRKRSEISDSKV
jgi:hypothetical protein